MKKLNRLKAFSLIELSIVILVVGILIAGVMQAKNLYSKSKLTSARSLTQSSPVLSIKNLTLWLETTSTTSFKSTETSDNSVITYWYDINQQTAQKNHFLNNSSSSPVYKEDCINNLPCLYFDGNAGANGLSTVQSFNTSSQYITLFAVLTTPNDNFIPNSGTANGLMILNGGAPLQFSTSGRMTYPYDQNNGYGLLYTTPLPLNKLSKNYIFSIVDNYTTTGIYEYINGVLANSTGANGNSVKTLGNMQIGYFPSVGWPENFKGNLAEIILYTKALTNEERQAVEKYLSQKWGISLS